VTAPTLPINPLEEEEDGQVVVVVAVVSATNAANPDILRATVPRAATPAVGTAVDTVVEALDPSVEEGRLGEFLA
jgi:hypothetical protein